jgi:hypothetical protein
VSFLTKAIAWLGNRRVTMTADELRARIAADTTDEDVDRFLPPSLRRYDAPFVGTAETESCVVRSLEHGLPKPDRVETRQWWRNECEPWTPARVTGVGIRTAYFSHRDAWADLDRLRKDPQWLYLGDGPEPAR